MYLKIAFLTIARLLLHVCRRYPPDTQPTTHPTHSQNFLFFIFFIFSAKQNYFYPCRRVLRRWRVGLEIVPKDVDVLSFDFWCDYFFAINVSL